MGYFYGLILILVTVLLLIGCITNNAYTQTGDGEHKVVTAADVDLGELNKDSDLQNTTTETSAITGIHKGTTLDLDVSKHTNIKESK